MNQMGFVELSIIKNDLLYRFSVPMGIPWKSAQDALEDMSIAVADHIKALEEQEASAKKEGE